MTTKTKHSIRILRSGLLAIALVALGAALGFCTEPNGSPSSPSSLKAAIENSEATGKPIMLVFTGSDWCIWCKRLDSDILETPEFSQWSKKVVHVEVDFPQMTNLPAKIAERNNKLQEIYANHVSTYPTVLFVDSKGKVLAKTGYVDGGANAWINNADRMLETVQQQRTGQSLSAK